MRKFSIVVAAVATLVASSAFATASSSATGSNFSYSLVDLDPSDGIAPSISFGSSSIYNASAAATVQLAGIDATQLNYASSLFGAVSSGNANSQSTAAARLSGDASAAGAVLHAEGSSIRGAQIATYSAGTTILRPAESVDPFASFTLSANTEVHFTMDVALRATLTTFLETASAFAYMDVFDADGAERKARLSADQTAAGTTQINDLLELYVDNFSTATKTYYADMGVEAIGGVLAPVPEPATYALMLPGLALLGWAASRRRLGEAKAAAR